MDAEDFNQIKANMKARKITGAYIAFQTSRSASNINMILRGDYPYYKGYGLPKYLYEWLVEHKLLEPTQEGFLTRRAADRKISFSFDENSLTDSPGARVVDLSNNRVIVLPDDVLWCNEHERQLELVDYDDESRYECPECRREDGEALGLA